jgi:hypothetical protein
VLPRGCFRGSYGIPAPIETILMSKHLILRFETNGPDKVRLEPQFKLAAEGRKHDSDSKG